MALEFVWEWFWNEDVSIVVEVRYDWGRKPQRYDSFCGLCRMAC